MNLISIYYWFKNLNIIFQLMFSYVADLLRLSQGISIIYSLDLALSGSGRIAVICLVLLLSISEALPALRLRGNRQPLSLTMAKWTLIVAFFVILAFKVVQTLLSLSS
jgi:hypothetical protein